MVRTRATKLVLQSVLKPHCACLHRYLEHSIILLLLTITIVLCFCLQITNIAAMLLVTSHPATL